MDQGRPLRSQKADEKESVKQKNEATKDDSGKADIDAMAPDIIKAIDNLKTDLKGDNNTLRQEITHLGQEINSKLDMLGEEVRSLLGQVDEAKSRLETVERWAAGTTEALSAILKQQKVLQHKLNDLESRSRRNNIRIFGVAEGEEGEHSVSEFAETLIQNELPVPTDMELKIQRAHRVGGPRPTPDNPQEPSLSTSKSSQPRSGF